MDSISEFVMTLNSGDEQSYVLEPGKTSIRAGFRQALKEPLNLSDAWEVALTYACYTHSFGNALLKPDQYHMVVKSAGKVALQKKLSPYVLYKSRRQILSWLAESVSLSRYDMLRDRPSIKITRISNDTSETLHLLTPTLIKEWSPSHLPSTAEEVVAYLNVVLQKLGKQNELRFSHLEGDSLQFELVAGYKYELFPELKTFLHYAGPSVMQPTRNEVVWKYTEFSNRGSDEVQVYHTDANIFVCCNTGTVMVDKTKFRSLKAVLTHAQQINMLIESYSNVDVEVEFYYTGVPTARMSLINEAAFVEWFRLSKPEPVPMSTATVVEFLERQRMKLDANVGKYIEFVNGGNNTLQIVLKKERGTARFTFSSNLQKLLQLEDNAFVLYDAQKTLTVTYSPRPSTVVKYGNFYLWGMNHGTLWVDPAQTAAALDLARYMVQVKMNTEKTTTSLTHSRAGMITKYLQLLNADTITTWLEDHAIMPVTRQELTEYLAKMVGALPDEQKSLVEFSAHGTGSMKMTLKERGRFILSSDLARFLDYGGTKDITVTNDPKFVWHYDAYSLVNRSGVTLHTLHEHQDELLLNVLPGHTLELHHGVQHVLGFQRMTAGSKVLTLDDTPIPTHYPWIERPMTLSFEDAHQVHTRDVTIPASFTEFYATKRDLWQNVTLSGLKVWPTLAEIAVHYKSTYTGYEVTLDYFADNILQDWFEHWGHPYIPDNHTAVAQYLNRATSQLPHDPNQLNFPWTAVTEVDGKTMLSMAVQGSVTIAMSEGMAYFVDRRGPRQISVYGEPSTIQYVRWEYKKRHTPCNVIPLRGANRYALQGEGAYCNFSPALRNVLTFLPARVEDSVAQIVVAYDLDVALRQPQLLSTVQLDHCHVEVDLVAPGFAKDKWRQVLATLPLDTVHHYGHTVGVDLPHSQYVPLVAPLRNVGEVRVHLRNDENDSVPFYTGIVLLQLHFRKHDGNVALARRASSHLGK